MSILKVNTIQHANGTEAMTIDSSGNITATGNIRASNPAFHVSKNNGSITASASEQVIVYNTVAVDTYNAYNTSTGQYVIPVTGIYLLYVFGVHDAGTEGIRVYIRKNGNHDIAACQNNWNGTGGGSYQGIGFPVIASLQQNDYVQIICANNHDYYGTENRFAGFGGYLIG